MKTLCTIIITALISMNILSQTPDWQWAIGAGGKGYEDAKDVTTDIYGNVYLTGWFRSPTIIFGNATLTNYDTSGTTDDIYVVKYDPSGNVIWAKSAGGNRIDWGTSITVDLSGNIFVSGFFKSSNLVFGADTLKRVGNSDMFLVKYDNNGNILWTKSGKGGGDFFGPSITNDINGNVYITGSFGHTKLVFDSISLINVGAFDMYLAKYDSSGNMIWAKSAGSYDDEFGSSISSDISGNVYVTGFFCDLTLVLGSTTLINTDNSGIPGNSCDMYIVKYDSSGNTLWAKSAGGANHDYGSSVTADESGNIFVTGGFQSPTIVFGNSILTNSTNSGRTPDLYLIKYDSSGNVIWAKSSGGIYYDFGSSITSDKTGNLFLTGSFHSQAIVFDQITLTNYNSIGDTSDIFIVKYNADGNVLWAKSAGGYNYEFVNSIAVNLTGSIFIAGSFLGHELVLGTNTLKNASEKPDIFLAKLSTTVGFSETQIQNEITIYPNPFTSQSTIRFSETQKNTSIKILNVFGKEIKIINCNGKEAIIEKEEMTSGLYFIQVTDEKNNTVIKRVIIQ